jgi:hypothetical protein
MTSLRRFATPVVFAAVFCSLVLVDPRPANASEEQAKEHLFATIKVLRQKYPALHDRREYGSGTLAEGKSEVFHEHFEAGTTYVILAVGCDGAADIDVGVGDSDGKLIEKDTEEDASPVVIFSPQYTGDYLTIVKMAKTTSSDPAHYAYQVFYIETER